MDNSFLPEEFLNPALLSVISHTFKFTHLKPSHPALADLGVRRVSSVLIQENWFPQIGLSDPASNPNDFVFFDDDAEFFSIEDLDVVPDPDSKLPFPSEVFDSYKLRVINVQLHRAGLLPG